MDFSRFSMNAGYKKVWAGSVATVPLLNLLFLLFIFFVCAAGGFCRLPLVPDTLPAVGSDNPGPAFNELIVRGEGNMLLNGRAVQPDQITGRLAACSARERVLLIKVSGDVPVSLLAGVWNKCRRAGAERINILTER